MKIDSDAKPQAGSYHPLCGTSSGCSLGYTKSNHVPPGYYTYPTSSCLLSALFYSPLYVGGQQVKWPDLAQPIGALHHRTSCEED